MGFNLTNELIDQTFPQLVQISGSVLLNGTGSVITDLDFTGSHVESASHAEFADQAYSASNATNALNADSASFVAGANVIGTVTSASYAVTASSVTGTVASASFANSASQAEFANSSSFALNFNPAATASYASFAATASYVTPLDQDVQITGSFNITGSARNASQIQGNFKQNLLPPGTNNQYDLINVPTTTIDGLTYNNINNFFADYSGFGSKYKDYFAIEYYDSFGYNYGSEWAVNPIQVNMSLIGQYTQFGGIKAELKKPSLIAGGRGTVSGSQTILQAGGTGSQALIYAYNGASMQLEATGSQGGSTAYINILSDSDIVNRALNKNIFSGSIDSQDGITAPSFTGSLLGLASDANDLIVGVKNTLGVTITKGQTLHATGVTGQNIDVITASCDTDMPAIGLALTDINASATGNAIISGKIVGVDTSTKVAGEPVYVGANGSLTGTKPTGSALIQNIGIVGKVDASDGEIVVMGAGRTNDLPNITQGYLWVGNGDSVATAVTSESLWTGKNISVNQITASGASFTSASIGYLRTITGSATIIGDEYIILNADSPTRRFAGIKVYDSGSGLTGSFEWDSVDDNWIQVETGGESAGMLTGPSGSKGSEVYPTANTLIKGTGNHTVVDTNITDDGSTVKINSNTQVTGSLNVSAGITGSLLGTATTASYVENSQTASYVNPLNQEVQITGSLNITGSDSLTVQGDVNFNIDQPAAASNTQILSAPGFTGTAGTNNGKTITINELVYQNFPAFGSTYENSYMFSQWDGFGYNYGFDFSMGAGRINAALNASGSGTAAQRSANFSVLDDTNASNTPEGDAVARYYGRTMELGLYNSETIAIGNNIVTPAGYTTANTHLTARDKVVIGSTEDTAYPYKGITRSFTNGSPTKDIELDYTGSVYLRQSGSIAGTPALIVTGSVTATSFTGSLLGTASDAVSASYAANAEEWNGSYTGTASITGSLIVSGGNFDVLGATRNGSSIDSNFKQNIAPPGTNNQYDLIAVSPTTLDGRTYSNVNNFFADYSGFGTQYKDYFAIEYYDSFSYGYGGEFSVNGVQARINVLPGNGQFGDLKVQQKKPADIASGRGTVSGSHVLIQAGGTGSQAMINAYNGASVQIQSLGSQGGSVGYMHLVATGSVNMASQGQELFLRAGSQVGGGYINVSGSVAQEVKTISIASNTGSMNVGQSNWHTITLASGSDTHLDAVIGGGSIKPGSTFSLEVKQPTTATDSYGTLSFAPEFKFAGGTAPTITAASGALDVLTFQTYDGSTFYGTAIQNFS